MKNILTFCTLLIFSMTLHAQAPSWTWVHTGENSNYAGLSGMCRDGSSNIYAAGWFGSQTIRFGNFTLYNYHYNPWNMNGVIFLVKYDASGSAQWAKRISGTYASIRCITSDQAGNITLCGEFEDSVTFDTTKLTSQLNFNIYIARYDANGIFQWAKQFGSMKSLACNALACDSLGNILLTGNFGGDSLVLPTITLHNSETNCSFSNCTDVFLLKTDGQGNLQWACSGGGPGTDVPASVCCDALGNIYVCGRLGYYGARFGNFTLSPPDYHSYHMFLVKYNSNGTPLWAKTDDSEDDVWANAVTTDPSGNVLLCGNHASVMHFDTVGLSYTGVNCWGDHPCPHSFVFKFNSSGHALWARQGAGSSFDRCMGIASDANGDMLITGNFQSPELRFGDKHVMNSNPWYGADVYVTKFSSNGAVQWVKSAGGASDEEAVTVLADNNNVFAGGMFYSNTAYFDSIQLHNLWTNDQDFYIGRLNNLVAGTREISGEQAFSIYPNPSSGIIFLDLQHVTGEKTISVYDMNGNCVKTFRSNEDHLQLPLGDISKGLYLVKVINENGVLCSKVIVE